MENEPPISTAVLSSTNEPSPSQCPACHVMIRPSDYFCFNCGKEIQEKPRVTSLLTQIVLYIGCLLLPPLGIIWGVRYLRYKGRQSKIIGIIAIVLTIISLVVSIVIAKNFFDNLSKAVNEQYSKQLGF